MIERLLNKTLAVYESVRVSDGQGGWQESYELSGSILGRVRPRSTAEPDIAGSEYGEVTHVVYSLTAPERGNRLVVDGMLLEVITVRNPSLLGHHYETDCREIQVKQSGVTV